MRKMTSVVSIAALAATAATVIAVGSANAAAPVTPPAADQNTVNVWLAPGVRYTGNTDDRSAVLSTPIGTLTSQGNALQVKDTTGRTVFGQRDFATPPKASTALPVATGIVAPQADSPTSAQPMPNPPAVPARPVDQQGDFDTALGRVAMQFGLATGVGAMIGGAVIGCPIGAVTGGALSAVVLPVTPLAMVGGCILGAGAVGGVGAVLGGALVGAPVGIASAVQMYNTLHAQGEM